MQHMRADKCRGCGAPIVWVPMPGGKSMPCDVEQVRYRARKGAKGKIVTPNGEVLSADIDVAPEEATASATYRTLQRARRRVSLGGGEYDSTTN